MLQVPPSWSHIFMGKSLKAVVTTAGLSEISETQSCKHIHGQPSVFCCMLHLFAGLWDKHKKKYYVISKKLFPNHSLPFMNFYGPFQEWKKPHLAQPAQKVQSCEGNRTWELAYRTFDLSPLKNIVDTPKWNAHKIEIQDFDMVAFSHSFLPFWRWKNNQTSSTFVQKETIYSCQKNQRKENLKKY